MNHFRFLAVGVSIVVVLAAATVQAQSTRHVAVGGNDAGNDCLSAASPCATVTHAIEQAAASDTILVGAGEFLTDGSNEGFVIDQSLIITGQGRDQTFLQAAADPSNGTGRVMFVDAGISVDVGDLTIRHGNAQSGSTTDRRGAGLYNAGADLSISAVDFVDNDAFGHGGGMYNASGSPVLTDVRFVGNVGSRGGAIYNAESSPVILNGVFRGNQASGGGGAIYSSSNSDPVLTNVLISGNFSGELGGGIRGVNSSPVLTNVTFVANRAINFGGGIQHSNVSNPDIRNSIFWNNEDETGVGTASASINNGGLVNATVSHSLVQGCNMAGEGWNDDCGDDSGGNLADALPRFVDMPAPAGAPTLAGNLRLQSASPAINAGNNDYVAGVSQDLDGYQRIWDGVVDLGPYEFGADTLFHDRFE